MRKGERTRHSSKQFPLRTVLSFGHLNRSQRLLHPLQSRSTPQRPRVIPRLFGKFPAKLFRARKGSRKVENRPWRIAIMNYLALGWKKCSEVGKKFPLRSNHPHLSPQKNNPSVPHGQPIPRALYPMAFAGPLGVKRKEVNPPFPGRHIQLPTVRDIFRPLAPQINPAFLYESERPLVQIRLSGHHKWNNPSAFLRSDRWVQAV